MLKPRSKILCLDLLISPIATLIASDPSPTTTQRQPSRINNVSIILAVIGLSSANRHVNARSAGSGPLLRSTECTDEGGVPKSNCGDACPPDDCHCSEPEPSPPLDVEIDAVRSRLGMVFLLSIPSKWLSLNLSTAPNSDGFRLCAADPEVIDGILVRDGEEATDDVEVDGEGGDTYFC